MGKKVNVVLWDGTVVSVDEEQAKTLDPTSRRETPVEGGQRAVKEYNTENTSAGRAALEGAADTLTLGAYGRFVTAAAGDGGERMRVTGQEHSTARAIGEVVGTVAPYGLLGKTLKGVTALTGVGRAAALGEAGSVAGRLAEGGLLAAGARVADSNITGDPLSIEGMAEDISVGGALNVMFGAAADKVFGAAERAASKGASKLSGLDAVEGNVITSRNASKVGAATGKANEARLALRNAESKQTLAAAKQTLEESPGYENVKAAYESAQDQARAFNKQVNKDASVYANATTPKALTKHLDALEEKQQELRAAIAKATRQQEEVALLQGDLPLSVGPAGEPQGTEEFGAVVKNQAKYKGKRGAAASTAPSEAAPIGEDFAANQKALTKLRTESSAARKAIKAGDTDKAASVLRGHFPEIPIKPGELQSVGPDLPDSLYDLGKVRKETIADFARHADESTHGELNNLAGELGYSPGEHPLDVLDVLHTRIREDYVNAAARLEKNGVEVAQKAANKAEWGEASAAVDAARAEGGYSEVGDWASQPGASKGTKPPGHLLDKPIDWTKRGIEYSAARLADVGGWKGAFLRTMAGSTVGYALDGVQGAFEGGSAMYSGGALAGKLGVRSKIASALAHYGKPLASAISKMGPITASLYAHFPSGEDDKEPDEGRAAVNRMNDVYRASQIAPDAVFEGMRGMMGTPGDMAFKLGQKFVAGLKYLAAYAPKDPGIDVTPSGSDWTPSFIETNEWAHRREAVLHPMEYVARVLQGDGHPAGVDALAFQWPAILQEVLQQASTKDWSDLSQQETEGLSLLFRQPLSALQHPDVQMMIQGNYLPQPEPQPQSAGKPGGGANGRPPAVNSTVAGSSVSGLTQG